MRTIAVLIDMEEGHLLPSFWLSRGLKGRGYRVCYLGVPSSERLVRNHGFEFIPVVPDKPSSVHYKGRKPASDKSVNYLGALMRGEMLDDIIASLQPDVMLIQSHYYTESLAIYYRYRLPVVFFTPHLRRYNRAIECERVVEDLCNFASGVAELCDLLTKSGVHFSNLKDIARLVLLFPELVMLPEAFDLPGRGDEPGVYYIGAGIDIKRKEEPFSWAGIDSNRALIYCARGSQPQLQSETNQRLIKDTLGAARARHDWQFIIATGKGVEVGDFTDVPANVILREWVPQLEVLSRANVMINHGGFGTIKECILMRVPMVVLPFEDFRDHSTSAARVVRHGLGVQSDVARVSSVELISLIEQVLNDQSFKLRVDLMREKFLQQDRFDLAAEVIEDAISRSRC
jgi:zeaxanthin glucosyltransferase